MKLEGLSFKAWHKLIQILLSKDPVNIPYEVTEIYITPFVGYICGCTELYNPCEHPLLKNNCARCGDIEPDIELSHWCYDCGCWKQCGNSNILMNRYCEDCETLEKDDIQIGIINQNDVKLIIRRFMKLGFLNIDKIKAFAEKYNEKELLKLIET